MSSWDRLIERLQILRGPQALWYPASMAPPGLPDGWIAFCRRAPGSQPPQAQHRWLDRDPNTRAWDLWVRADGVPCTSHTSTGLVIRRNQPFRGASGFLVMVDAVAARFADDTQPVAHVGFRQRRQDEGIDGPALDEPSGAEPTLPTGPALGLGAVDLRMRYRRYQLDKSVQMALGAATGLVVGLAFVALVAAAGDPGPMALFWGVLWGSNVAVWSKDWWHWVLLRRHGVRFLWTDKALDGALAQAKPVAPA